ncbi:response regulator transcription factor [Arthrobacter sp. NQ7]|uniref:response regulator transcription factor n=1 Tax=Arthrobacter sp. NQ7 TaxID=3032303 RepID=UPI00240FAD8B|nr:response regulator transcription factor [Arthrobacter sp. NQ7]MDJ0458642.1 response regulator transcription factor [Arthrobacter sp. NQ7]
MTIRVLLVDDQALLRGTFKLLLESAPDMEVVGEASTGAEAVHHALSERADVVLMDIRMPDMDGIEATRRITGNEDLAGVKILVLTTFETDELVVEAIRAGASGFLGKGVDPADLLDAIRTVASGEALLSPVATTALITQFLARPHVNSNSFASGLNELTARELEITALVGSGLSNTEIAERLFISPATAKTHLHRAMMKTNSRDRAQLVVFAYQNGLVTAGG